LPGDVLITGTPHGVGAGRTPPVFLKDGDTISIEVEGLGTLTNTCQEEQI
jgi:2-keto-4-pentenoate hydratase/2-oxohepta-3-ene-1,7-dioic acid hydratase in catechol pathway